MALAVNRTSTFLKKCDRSNHKPDSNNKCAAGRCQHSCQPSAVAKCPHAWTLRYRVNGKQLEKSFRDEVHQTTGRKAYGSGKKLAQEYQLKLSKHRPSGIELVDNGPSHAQVTTVASGGTPDGTPTLPHARPWRSDH